MSWYQKFAVPAPFHRLDLFSLVEPMAESEDEITFAHRLYMVVPHAIGGKVLLREVAAYSLPKFLKIDEPQQTGSGEIE